MMNLCKRRVTADANPCATAGLRMFRASRAGKGVAVLQQVLASNAIMYRDSVSSWQEALSIVSKPLVDSGAITQGYVDAMHDSIASPGGTYIDLGGKVALAHARPEAGVQRTALSVLHVGEPFLLADSADHPIVTMFCLAAKDSNSHIDMMQSLAGLLADEKELTALNSASSQEQLAMLLTTER